MSRAIRIDHISRPQADGMVCSREFRFLGTHFGLFPSAMHRKFNRILALAPAGRCRYNTMVKSVSASAAQSAPAAAIVVVKDFPIKVQFLSCLLEIGSQESQLSF